jgi:uncharacterized membrane protein
MVVPATGSGVVARFEIRTVDMDRPWAWLAAGWRDFLAAPAVGLVYGLVSSSSGIGLTALIWAFDIFYLSLPLAAGFALLAPILAVGLYETSRQLAEGGKPTLASALIAWRGRPQLLVMAGLLMLFMLAWVRVALLLFALFFSEDPPRPDPYFLLDVFFSARTIPFLLVGTVIGFVLAAAAFMVSVISIPMLLDRDVSAFTAAIASINAVRQSPKAMFLWAWLIALFTIAGLAPFYLGLIVTLPIIGHASWHAYRDIVGAGNCE